MIPPLLVCGLRYQNSRVGYSRGALPSASSRHAAPYTAVSATKRICSRFNFSQICRHVKIDFRNHCTIVIATDEHMITWVPLCDPET